MFIVKKVRFKNFRSYGNSFTEIDLTRSNSTVITAPNGSGKSSILMAIEFALFGRVSNGINKNDLVNSINKNHCVVEVECSCHGKDILVRRGIKPNLIEFHIDGVLVDQDASSRDYQSKFEEEVLGFNISSFRQVVSISGGSYTPFLLLSAGNRRKIVEELLNLTIFSKMHQIHLGDVSNNREMIGQTESEIAKLESSLASLKKGLANLNAQEETYRKSIEDQIRTTEERIAAIQSDIEAATHQQEALGPEIERHKKAISKRSKMMDYRKDINKKIKKLEEVITFFTDHDHCPTCNQTIDQAFKDESIKPRKDKTNELQRSLEELDATMAKVEEDIQSLEGVLDQIKDIQLKILSDSKRITDLQKFVKDQTKLLTKRSANGDELHEDIKKTTEDITLNKERRLALLEEKQYNDLIAAIIKDNGIKSKIISQYIPHLNKEINRYLQIMNLNLTFTIDETFNERILSRFKDELSYSSFSAGERARIDIAILFTWRELAKMKNSLSCNLLFLDEIFDAVLDDEGLEAFVNLLRHHLKGTNVFMISHRPELVDKFESNLRIAKSGNFSHIEG